MKTIFYYISVFIIGVVFLLSTSGFTVYSHYCSVNGSSFSIVASGSMSDCESCGIEEEPSENSCCSEKKQCLPVQSDDDCCTDQNYFVKIDIDVNIPSDNSNKEINITSPIEISLIEDYNNQVNITDVISENYNLPPPKTGSKIILFLSKQKTAPDPLA